ncbi:MAG: sigma-54-dependent Fis family transcriptional regulator [Deltaproteobacteria bacterium]|nr:sigma-54-dependent Fis family transcriptional regulator [Deltaproteobacteria bacterium]
MARILVVDDDQSMRELLEILLLQEGYDVDCAHGGGEAISKIEKSPYDVIVSDIRMQKVDGLEVLRRAKKVHPDVGVVMISAYASPETAVEAMREGAYDYFPKPFNTERLKEVIAHIIRERKETVPAAPDLHSEQGFGRIIGISPQMLRIYDLIRRVSKTDSNVLITGESGTGKELIARAIHEEGLRKDRPFITINCGGIPENLLESELFGYKKGAFTGAASDRMGLLEAANTGTFFMDELGELSPVMQVKLLRVLQERMCKPLGGVREVPLEIRFIFATNKDLEQEVIRRNFREDLFFRVNVIQVQVPPLRERKEDIPLLAEFFLKKYSRQQDKNIRKISSYALEILKDYNFPGNVRELENIVERSVALESSNIVLPESMTLSHYKQIKEAGEGDTPFHDIPDEGINLDEILARYEADFVTKALSKTHGNRKRCAELLGINLRSLRYRMEKLGLKGDDD